ncbi:MAG TPA: autotransporter-associated beta strand repeat-containing protein [Pirellulales bacterium]|nr:autotransporter-associated beta strand repeat-containing protein [Pirellulales bacterium]
MLTSARRPVFQHFYVPLNSRLIVVLASCICTCILLSQTQPASAQVNYLWNVAGPADWNTAANWNPATVPANPGALTATNGAYAHIGNGGIAQITSTAGTTPTIDNLLFDGTSAGEVDQSSDTLTLTGMDALAVPVGPGELRMGVTGQADKYKLGSIAGVGGTGSISAIEIHVGEAGGGTAPASTFTQGNAASDTSNVTTTGRLYIGGADATTPAVAAGGHGVYNLNEGTLTVGSAAGGAAGGAAGAGGSAFIGYNGNSVGVLNISNTGDLEVSAGDFHIGDTANATGTVNQSGGTANIETGNGNWLFVGQNGGTGTYNLSGGALSSPFNPSNGSINAAWQVVGEGASTGTGAHGSTGMFKQTGGTNNVGGRLYIGAAGGTGTYALSAGTLTVGNNYNGSLFVGDSVSTGGPAIAGSVGTLTISGTGDLEIPTNGDAHVANGAGSVGVINQTGGTFNGPIGGSWMFVGDGGNGTYNLSGGTMNVGARMVNARGATSHGTFNITGTASLTTGSDLDVDNGGVGVFNQSAGTTVNTGGGWLFAGTSGNAGASGTYNMMGGSLTTGRIVIGSNTSSGNNNGTGHFIQTGGTVTSHNDVSLGDGNGATGDYTISGPAGGPNAVTLVASTQVENANGGQGLLLGWGATGTMNQNGGLVTATTAAAGVEGVGFNGANSNAGHGTYNLSGGILNTAAVYKINVNGTGTFNFNGGILQVAAPTGNRPIFMGPGNPNLADGTPVPALTAANIKVGGAIIDTNGYNPTISQVLSHDSTLGPAVSNPPVPPAGLDGGLTLADSSGIPVTANTPTGSSINSVAGSLALTGANTFNGNTNVTTNSAGQTATLILGNTLALQNSTLNLTVTNSVHFNHFASDGVTVLGAFTLGGLTGAGNLSLSDSSPAPIALSIGNNNTTTTYTGQLGTAADGASLVKIGGGTLHLTNTQLYTGGTTINQGTLSLSGAPASLANSSSVDVGGGANSLLSQVSSGTLPTLLSQGGASAGAVHVHGPEASVAGNIAVGDIGTLNAASLILDAGANASFVLGAPGTGGSPAGSHADLMAVTGALTLPASGSVALNFTDNANAGGLGSLGLGTYKLFTAASIANFSSTSFGPISSPAPGDSYVFTEVGTTEIDMNVVQLIWTGLAKPDNQWVTGGNWSSTVPGSTTSTINSDIADFSGAGNGNTTIKIDLNRNVKGLTFDTASAAAYTIGDSGPNGGNALRLSAAGSIQSSSTVVNTETVNAPLVLEGNYTFSSSPASATNVLNIAGGVTGVTGITVLTLTGSNTGANTISGVIGNGTAPSVGLSKTGAGTWVLAGNNTFTGAVSIAAGTLRVGNVGALNSTTPNAVLFTGPSTGILDLNGNSVTISGLIGGALGSGTVTTNGGPATLTINVPAAATPSYASVLADGSGVGNKLSLTVSGAGSQTLTGNNTYSGTTNVTGTLRVGNTNALQNSTLNYTVANSVQFLGGIGSFTLGGLSGGAGPINLSLLDTSATPAPIALSVGNNNANTSYAGTLGAAADGASFVKVGTGTLTLTDAPTPLLYSGTTTVSAGTLAFGATSAQSYGGTILGAGAVAASGPGSLTLTGNSTWSGGLNVAAGVSVTAGPWVTATNAAATPLGSGPVTLNTGSTLNLAGNGTATQAYAAGLTVAGNSTVNVTSTAPPSAASMGNLSIGAQLNLTGDAGSSLSLGTTTLTANSTFNPAANTTLTVGSIGGAFGVSKIGAGTLIVPSAGTYTGGTNISVGTVVVQDSASLGTNTIQISGGSKLQLAAVVPAVKPAISIKFEGGSNGGAPTSLNSTDVAGVYPVSNWNNVNSNNVSNTPGSGTNTNIDSPMGGTIVDSNGATTAATIAFQSNNTWGVAQNNPTPNDVLMNGYLDLNFGGNNLTAVTMKNLPYTRVDVYAYVGSDGNGRTGHGTVTQSATGPFYFITDDNMFSVANGGPGFVQGTATTAATAANATYLLFSGVPTAAGEIDFTLMGDTNNAGLHGLEFVNATPPVAMANALTLTGNATIDLTGSATGAISGNLSMGGTTLFITGAGDVSVLNSPFTLSLGAATLSGNPTFDVADNGTGVGTLRLASLNTGGAARTITKVNAGILEIDGASTLTAASVINVNAGGVRFKNTTGAATIGAGTVVNVATGTSLELAGSVSDLSSPDSPPSPATAVLRAHVVNRGSLLVSGTHQQTGGIDGTGGVTTVNSGSDLTADHIVQSSLVIGGTATSAALVTIASSDASGNPLASGFAVAGSLSPSGPFAAGTDGGSSLLASGGSSAGSSSSLGGANLGSGQASVPEPASLLLMALGGGIALLAVLRRKINRR